MFDNSICGVQLYLKDERNCFWLMMHKEVTVHLQTTDIKIINTHKD